jgi:hypothetical protein
MRCSTSCLAPVAAAVVGLSWSTARADVSDPSAAESQFRRGRASADAGDYPRACTAFGESQRLEPAPGTLLNLADCEEHLGRVASAEAHFLAVEGALPATDERRAVAHERAAALAPRVPWLVITLVPDAPRDARVFRDDVEVDGDTLFAPWPLDPGPHVILVVAQGRQANIATVVAVEGETIHLVVSPGPLTTRATAGPTADHAATWIVGGAGLLSLGVGAYFGGRALAERSASDAGCPGGACASAASMATYQSALGDARASDVALGIGAAAIVVAGCLWLTSRDTTTARAALRLTSSGIGGAW